MGYGVMDGQKLMNDPDMKWCDVARAYYERYVVGNNIEGYDAGCSYVRNDDLFEDRMRELCTEFGDEYDDTKSKRASLKTLHMVFRSNDILERSCEFVPTDLYRLTRDGNVLLEGTLPELETFKTIEYDDNEWWFAKSAQGTLLNNEQEVNDYQSNILRERKYVDKDTIDNFVLWKAE